MKEAEGRKRTQSVKRYMFYLILLVTFASGTKAATVTANDLVYALDESSMTAAVTAFNNDTTLFVTIPATVSYEGKDYTVTAVGDSVFFHVNSVMKVTLPNTLKSIGACTFAESDIEAINIPASVTAIGDEAFVCNGNLLLTVDEDNPSYIVVDSVLFTKDMAQLILYQKKGSSYVVPDGEKILAESTTDAYVALPDNDLKGSITDTYFGEAGKVLLPMRNKTDDTKYCFYKTTEATVPANTAWLTEAQVGGDAVDIVFAGTTGLNDIPVDQPAAVGTDRVYNMDGTYEPNPQKGVVYIVNGKKVMYIK